MIRSWLARLQYFGRAAARGLQASPLPTSVAIATIAVTLVLIGAFSLLVLNMEELLTRFGEEVRLSAYLEDDVAEEELARLIETVRTVEGVADVGFRSKAEALERFREEIGGNPALLEGLDENPLPASLEIGLLPARRSPEGLAVVAEAVDGLPGISELGPTHQWVEGYAGVLQLLRIGGVALAGVLTFAALLIVTNTIRLAVYARRDELDILMLVGASRTFVSVPFLLEGVLQGLIGGLLALVLLAILFAVMVPGLADGLQFLLGHSDPQFLGGRGSLRLVLGGVGLGVIGSATALVQGLRG